jgi:5-methylcytosine-specific restriction endonuclease McrA
VLRILKCDADEIRYWLIQQHGEACACCGVMGEALQVDHILPVHQGGGGRWLDNYQLLCIGCHKSKSVRERRSLSY